MENLAVKVKQRRGIWQVAPSKKRGAMKRDIIIIEDKAVSVTGNDVWCRHRIATAPYDRPGSERRHQSCPQVGRAERLQGVPLHAAWKRAVRGRVRAWNHYSDCFSAEHLQHLPVPHVAGRKGSLTREAANIRDVYTERKNCVLLKISNENYTKEFLYGSLSK